MTLPAADRAMLGRIEASGDAIVARAIGWCAVNSGSFNPAGLDRQRALLETAFAILPGALRTIALADRVEIDAAGDERRAAGGSAIHVAVRPDAPLRVVLTGHYDTVYPADTAFTDVARRGDGALHGPGIADMKGGISAMLAALEAFEAHPAAPAIGYDVLLSPDEEIGSPGSAPLLARLAPGAALGMTYEPALADGTLVSARKGSGNYQLVVRGRAAHAGRDFASGRNAITAAARLAAALDGLNGDREGVTLNVARIDGGGAVNIVPDRAVVRFNTRFPSPEDGAWIERAIDACLAEPAPEGIDISLHGGVTRPAKPFTPEQERLFADVRATAALIGQAIAWAPSGGVCEGNNLFAAGLANVDTLGVRGGDIHSDREFAWPESFVERAQLSALLLARLATGAIDASRFRRGGR